MHVKDCQCNPLLVPLRTNFRICIAYVSGLKAFDKLHLVVHHLVLNGKMCLE